MLRQQRRILCVRRHDKKNERCRVRQQAPLANGIGGRKKAKSEVKKSQGLWQASKLSMSALII